MGSTLRKIPNDLVILFATIWLQQSKVLGSYKKYLYEEVRYDTVKNSVELKYAICTAGKYQDYLHGSGLLRSEKQWL
jgi:hypothetical protein